MFYPIDLLSHRRRGKLASCWLAAVTNEKLFKKYYNSVAIKKMNVITTCEEILQGIEIRNGRTYRFSLYLSSQLMCGITRIHFYQTMYYQKEIFEIQQKLEFAASLEKAKLEFDAVRGLDLSPVMELHSVLDPDFRNAQLDENLHMLTGEIPDNKLQMIMQDATCLNFGALTDEELDLILDHNGDIILENLQITDDSKDKNGAEAITGAGIKEEIYRERYSPRVILSPVFVDTSKRKDKSKGKLSLTPQKRSSHQEKVETPTKKRRLSFNDEAIPTSPAPLEDMTILATNLPTEDTLLKQAPHAIKTTYLASFQQPTYEVDMELESLHSNFFVIKKHPRKGQIIDKEITLQNKLFVKWHENINIHCKSSTIPLIHGPTSANDLFNQPSYWSAQWSVSLRNLFIRCITAPITDRDQHFEFINDMQSQEIIRLGETMTKQDLPTEEISGLGKTHIPITDGSALDSLPNILPVISMVDTGLTMPLITEPIPDTIAFEDVSVSGERLNQKMAMDINDTDETVLEDIEVLLERQRRTSKAKDHVLESPTLSSGVSQTALTSHEIMALIEVGWHTRQYIKFSELISKDTYTNADAATVFYILLELHVQRKLVLQQTACYHTLWIRKYDI